MLNKRRQKLKFMNIIKKTIAAIVIAAASMPTQAEFVTGNQLANDLRERAKYETGNGGLTYGAISSSGFISGVADFANDGKHVCFPEATTSGQVNAVVTKYVLDNPQDWNESAVDLVYMAIREAFPCKKKGAK